MEKKLIIRTLIFITLLFAFESSSAKEKKKTYYFECQVTSNSDSSFFGNVKFRTTDLAKSIEVTRIEYVIYDSAKTKYKINAEDFTDLLIKSDYGDLHYRSIITKKGKRFLLLKKTGRIGLYQYWEYPCKIMIYVNANAYCWGKRPKEYYLEDSLNDSIVHVCKKNYKKELKLLFKANESFAHKIGRKHYRYKNINEIVKEFNQGK